MGRPAAALLVILLAATANARPPDRLIHMQPEGTRFEKAPRGTWEAVSSDPEIVEAQYFDTAEVFLQAKKKGTTLVMLANHELGQAWFWKVKVAESAEVSLPDPAVFQKSCNCGQGEPEFPMTCKVENPTCLESLGPLLENTDLTQKYLKIHYTVEGLQALLKHLDQALKSKGHRGIKLAFSGVNLRITGKLPDRQAWHQLIIDIYQGMVGKLVIDNRIEISQAKDDRR